MARRSVGLRNGTPRDALVSSSLGLIPRGVKRAQEALGLVGDSSPSPNPVENDWIFVPVVASAIGPKRAEEDTAVKPSSVLKVVDLVASHSSSSTARPLRHSVEHVESDAVVVAAKRHRPKGPMLPEPQRAAKGSLRHAVAIAQDQEEMEKAVDVFKEACYAPQTVSTKSSLRNTWNTISQQLGLEPLPLTPEKVVKVSAVLCASGLRSTYSYLCEMRQWHIRSGFQWTNELDLCAKDTKRAATRGLGPPTKAEEIQEDILKEVWVHCTHVEGQAHWPALRHEVWVLAVAFLLRETELAGLRMSQDEVFLDLKKKCVTLYLPVSKSDPMGRGCRRTLSCTCGKLRVFNCPFCAALALARSQVTRAEVDPASARARDLPLVASVECPWDTIKKEFVIEAIKADVNAVVTEMPEMSTRVNSERVAGHSFRRTGAKGLARKGIPIELIQFMARHSSNAILGYVEEAIEESPSGAARLQEHMELRELVNLALKECKDLKDSIEMVTDRLRFSSKGTPIQLDKDYVLQTFDRISKDREEVPDWDLDSTRVGRSAYGSQIPLHFAANMGRLDAAQLLLGARADVRAKDHDGSGPQRDDLAPSRTPLHCAANSGKLEAAQLLLGARADVRAKDHDGSGPQRDDLAPSRTARDLAREYARQWQYGNSEVVRLLEDAVAWPHRVQTVFK
eukprot:Skav213607  [mRNA]  locus=scaffold1971:102312:108618:+ [translate_table: standard]